MEQLLDIAAGFSIVSAIILMVTYTLQYRRWNKSWTSIVSAVVLLMTFLGVQLLHLLQPEGAAPLYDSKLYSTLILLSAPAFYLFLREYFVVDAQPDKYSLLHLMPLIINFVIPNSWSIPISFALGAAYAGRSLYQLYQLRADRKRASIEAIALCFFFLAAVVICVLAAVSAMQDPRVFITAYGILVGLSFVVVLVTLLLYPDVASNVVEAAEVRYAKSTLNGVDRNARLQRLDALMREEHASRDETLNLGKLAEQLSLSTHQLSELVNSEYGFGFSKYVRQCRIDDAKQRLLAEPSASILSVSLEVGFTSQSSFYAAFAEIVGETPGAYRRRHAQ